MEGAQIVEGGRDGQGEEEIKNAGRREEGGKEDEGKERNVNCYLLFISMLLFIGVL